MQQEELPPNNQEPPLFSEVGRKGEGGGTEGRREGGKEGEREGGSRGRDRRSRKEGGGRRRKEQREMEERDEGGREGFLKVSVPLCCL